MSLRRTRNWTQYRGNILTTPPGVEPVISSELQNFLRADSTTLPGPDALLYLTQARQWIEDLTSIAFIHQSWTLTLDQWPHSTNGQWWSGVREGAMSEIFDPANLSSVYLPRYPLASVTSVTTYNEAGVANALTVGDLFNIDSRQRPGRLTLRRGQAWPTALRTSNAIEIVYVAGYGASSPAVPAPLRRAILQLASYLYTHRGDGCEMGQAIRDSGVSGILDTYTVRSI